MDAAAHRIIKQARDLLVDGLRLGLNDIAHVNSPPVPYPHGLDTDQARELDRIVWQLWDIMGNDPAPPECAHCGDPITQPRTGRPRRFCNDACKAADYRARQADAATEDEQQ